MWLSVLAAVVVCGLCVGAEERATVTPVMWVGRHADTEVASATVDGAGNLIVVGRSWTDGLGTKGVFQRRSQARSNYGFYSLAENRSLPVTSTWTGGTGGGLVVDSTNGRRVCWAGQGLAGTLCSEDAGRHWKTVRGLTAFRSVGYGSVTGVQGNLLVAPVLDAGSWDPQARFAPAVSRDGGATFSVTTPNPGLNWGWHSDPVAPCRLISPRTDYRSDDCGMSWMTLSSGIREARLDVGSYHPDPDVLLGYRGAFRHTSDAIYWSTDWGISWRPLFPAYPAEWVMPVMHPGKAGMWLARIWQGGWMGNDLSGRGWVPFAGLPPNADAIVDYTCGNVYLREEQGSGTVYSVTDRELGPGRKILEGVGVVAVAPCEGVYYSQNPTADAFVAKFDPQGKLLHFTYLGGSGEETVRSVAVDGQGDIYVSGWSQSPDFPSSHRLRPGSQGFVVKLSGDLSELRFSTRVPANDAPKMKLGSDGSVFLLGVTDDLTMPAAGASISRVFEFVPPGTSSLEGNGYLLRLAADGRELLYSTALGLGYPFGFALDGDETAYVWRHGSLPGGPVRPTAAFHKLDLKEGRVLWSVLPGNVLGTAREVEVQANGDVLVTGGVANASAPFPQELASFQAVANSSSRFPLPVSRHSLTEGYVARVASDGRLLAGTFLGGLGQDYFTGSMVAADGSVVVVGSTAPGKFNTRSITEQTSHESPMGFVAKLDGKMQKAEFSTLLTDLVPAAAVPHAEGGYWLIGTGKVDPDGWGANGIVLARVTTEPARLPRMDQLSMDVVPDGVELQLRTDVLWPASTALLTGEGLGDTPTVTLGGEPMEVRLVRPGRVWFRVPAGHRRGVFDLVVEAGGVRSDPVRVRVQ